MKLRTVTVDGKKEVTRKLTFQIAWFQRYPWLHYDCSKNVVLCFYCAKAHNMSLLSLYANADDTFVSTGFTNWNKAISKFQAHEKTACHSFAVMQIKQQQAPTVAAQVSAQKATEQAAARSALIKVLQSIRYLARQGLPLRGHVESNGNFPQLLQLMAKDDKYLSWWLSQTTNFTSPGCQNEVLEMMSLDIVRAIAQTVKDESQQFAVVVDGTQDCSGEEQESICIRYVDRQLNVNETFVGLYTPSDTTGKTLSSMILDVLTRLSLSVADLRAQTYDGAANMSGMYNGCQAFITSAQPLAIFFHCSAHCANLVAEHTASSNRLVRDAMQLIQELSSCNNRSGKFKKFFNDCRASLSCDTQVHTLKPLCPTRWLTRVSAVTSVLDQYAAVVSALDSMASDKGDSGVKCRGLLAHFNKGVTVLILKIVAAVFSVIEQLNRSLQAESATVSGMIAAVDAVVLELRRLRTDERFHSIMLDTSSFIAKHDLDEVDVPRVRRPSRRYDTDSDAHIASSVEEHYRAAYFEVIDSAISQLSDRFDKESPGLSAYLQLELMLISAVVDRTVCQKYPELNESDLSIQLQMFRSQYNFDSVNSARQVLQTMCPEVRKLFTQVERLIRLMLVCPVSSCSAERSFSCLRRLKTWLRSTMSETRLNHVAVCNIHQDRLDGIDIVELGKAFASRSDIRKTLFGQWA